MLSFILGSPGSGKTNELIRRAKADIECGKKVLIIVPEPMMLSSERELSSAFGASRNNLSYEVTGFRRLSNIVFRSCGGLCYNYLDKGGCAIMMWRVLSELNRELNTFKPGAGTDIGLVSSMMSLFDIFADHGISPTEFGEAVDSLPDDLQPKAQDIATVYTRYHKLIHDGFDSTKDDMFKAAELILEYDLFSDTKIYIDNFTGFDPCQYKIIEALLKVSGELTVSLCMSGDRDREIFEKPAGTKDKLTKIAGRIGIEVAEDITLKSERTADFAFFEKYCFDHYSNTQYSAMPDNFTLVEAEDIYSECELVCADIVKQIKQGSRFRELCIVMSDPTCYKGILDSVLQRHGIPYHFSVRDDIVQMPLIKHLICALNIIIYNWRLQDVISYIKTGFCSISDSECDIIEEYASTWSISGGMWRMDSNWNMNPNGYTDRLSETDAETLIHVNDIRDKLREPILSLAGSLNSKTPAAEAAVSVYNFLSKTVDIECLSDEDTACWNALISALEQLSLCGGDMPIGDLETFKRLVRLMASQTDFALIPATVDELSCLPITSLRDSGVKKCYIIGACDGSYPSVFKENDLISDEMRKALCECRISLPFDPEEIQNEQLRLLWSRVLDCEKVWITRYTSSLDGKECLPSEVVYELIRLFPKISVKSEKDFDIYDLIYDEACAIDRLTDPVYGDNLIKLFSESGKYSDVIEALSVPLTTTLCSVDDPENLKVFSGDINLTQTRVDSYVKCKFAYQLQYVLNLREQRKISYDPRDVGTFIHALLEEFFTYMRDMAKQGRSVTNEDITATVDRLVDAYISRTCGDEGVISKRMQAMFSRLRKQSLIFVRSIYKEFENSDFQPVLFEVSISDNESDAVSPFRCKLSDGSSVYIYGQIDRVDTYEKDGNIYVRVVDYKTGKKEFLRRDLELGLNLQMFLYMFSILENEEKFCKLLGCNGNIVPAGVMYYMASLPAITRETKTEENDALAMIMDNIQRQGMLLDDVEVIKAMCRDESGMAIPAGISFNGQHKKPDAVYTLDSLEEIKQTIAATLSRIAGSLKSGEANAEPMRIDQKIPCSYCRMRSVCRHSKDGGTGEDE